MINSEWKKLDMTDEWMNSAYDEDGGVAVCDLCGEEMKWSPRKKRWYCPECGQEMDRATYFNHIGANPPGEDCIRACEENYPFCKKTCIWHDIDPDDPMMD